MPQPEPTPQERTEALFDVLWDCWEIIAQHEAAKALSATIKPPSFPVK